ncbi:hypothetical protein [Salinicoccus sp. Marseille-QA3877]
MKKLKLLFLPFVVVLLILSACGNDEPEVESGNVTEEESSENEDVVQEGKVTEESSGDELFKDNDSGHAQVDGCEIGNDGIEDTLNCSVDLPEEYQAHDNDIRDADEKSAEVAGELFDELKMLPNTKGPSKMYVEEVSNNTFETYITFEVGESGIGLQHYDTYKTILENALNNYEKTIRYVVRAYDENFTDNANVKTVSYLSKVPDEVGSEEIGVYTANEAHTWVVLQFNLEECAQNNCTAESTEEIYKYTNFMDTSDFMYEELNIEEYDVDESLFKGNF